MKTKLLFICALLFTCSQSFAQLYMHEPFDYSPIGNSLLTPAVNTNPGTGTTWNNYTAGSPADMTIEAEPGWGTDPNVANQIFDLGSTGNSVFWKGGGEDGELKFATEAAPVNSGSIYLSFFIHVRGWDTTTGGNSPAIYRHTGFGINDNGNNGSSLFFGPGSVAGTYNIGYGNSDSQNTTNPDVVFHPTDYTYVDIGTDPDDSNAKQFFIVIKYTFDGSGAGAMWINPSVDEIRVAGYWEEVTGRQGLSVSKNEIIRSVKLYPNPAQDVINIESKTIKLSSVDMYNVLGAKVMSSEILNDRINVSNLTKGVYFMKINAEEGGSATKKIVIE